MSVLPLLTAGCLAPALIARARRRRSPVTLLLAALSLAAIGIAGLLSMFFDWRGGWALILAVPALCLAAWLPPRASGLDGTLSFLAAHRRLRGWSIAGLTLVILVGGVEWSIFVLDKVGVLELEQPLRTMLKQGNEDWRAASIADHTREPDPVLFWRPKPVPPYNSQRFQGPIAAVPKPADVFRVFCYGDSNTDGHTGDGGWPLRLARLAAARSWASGKRPEVINAGVMGYSSHQGLMRCKEEIGTYRPDLLLVSFGWNEAPEALGKPDKEFEIPARPIILVQRALLRFRSYQMLRTWKRRWTSEPPKTVGPRVSCADYVENLAAFRRLAAEHGAKVVFLTRPHQRSAAELAASPGWRATIPAYNQALLDYAAREKAPCIDVRARFADRAQLFADECHFTAAGHDLMAELLLAELPRLIAR